MTKWRYRPNSVPILIICRDKVSVLRELVDWLALAGHENLVLVDNASTYEPLLTYFAETPFQVVRLDENLGPHGSIWGSGLYAKFATDRPYVVTDSDVMPADECPLDLVEHLHWVLNRYSDYFKCGPALRIDDLPDCYQQRDAVMRFESRYWHRRLGRNLFDAPIDTTFSLYRPRQGFDYGPALRIGNPYWFRHVPWYCNSDNPSAEEIYYAKYRQSDVSHWGIDDAGEVEALQMPSMKARLSWTLRKRSARGRCAFRGEPLRRFDLM